MAIEDKAEFRLAWARVVVAATDSALRADLGHDPVAAFAQRRYAATTAASKKQLSESVHAHLGPAADAIAQQEEAADNAGTTSGSPLLACATTASATATQARDCGGSATQATSLPCWGTSPSSRASTMSGAADRGDFGTAAQSGSIGCIGTAAASARYAGPPDRPAPPASSAPAVRDFMPRGAAV
jgi:hypothetical protein